jgi:hypothetical protein
MNGGRESGLRSESVQVRIDSELAAKLVDPAAPEVLRPAPGVRGSDLAELASGLLIASSAAANMTTLILAKDQVAAFAQKLLAAMKGGRNSVELSAKVNGTKATVKISTSDPEVEVVRAIQALVDSLAADHGSDGEHSE